CRWESNPHSPVYHTGAVCPCEAVLQNGLTRNSIQLRQGSGHPCLLKRTRVFAFWGELCRFPSRINAKKLPCSRQALARESESTPRCGVKGGKIRLWISGT